MSAHSIHSMVKLFLRISILLLFLFSLGLVSLWGQKESVKTGLWSEADTWSPPGVPSTSDAVTIKPGHLVTINSGITVNVGVLTVEGALEVLSSSVTFGANSQVTPTGIYRHGVNGGTVGGTAPAHITWALGSTLEVTGVTDAITITAAQSYHHVVWNCVGQTSTLAFNNNFQTIGGDLKFEHTGSGRVNFSDVFQSLIYTISRDLVVSQSARISLRSNDNTGNSFNLPTLKIGRSLLNNSDQVDAFTSCDNCSTQSHRGYASIEFTGIGTLNLGNISTTGNVG